MEAKDAGSFINRDAAAPSYCTGYKQQVPRHMKGWRVVGQEEHEQRP